MICVDILYKGKNISSCGCLDGSCFTLKAVIVCSASNIVDIDIPSTENSTESQSCNLHLGIWSDDVDSVDSLKRVRLLSGSICNFKPNR